MKDIHWIILIIFIPVIRQVFVAHASYFSYEHKSPVRLENWKVRP